MTAFQLSRFPCNPILAPLAHHGWENFCVFNSAAVQFVDGVHLLYRAQGFDHLSTIGYAHLADGFRVSEREPLPIFRIEPREVRRPLRMSERVQSNIRTEYVSGGNFFGAEDPRATVFESRVYMIFVYYDGSTRPRLAHTCLSIDDFQARRWRWTSPQFMSSPQIVEKSGALFPRRIQGKVVTMHRYFPHIQIDFRDEFDFSEGQWLRADREIRVRPGMWDSRKIGAGAPPIETADGWLLIYYGVDDADASKYCIGAMLLDLEEPWRVLGRSPQPILRPMASYENEGFKTGILYPCGAAIIAGQVIVYYGASDSYVAAASVSLSRLIEELKSSEGQIRRQS